MGVLKFRLPVRDHARRAADCRKAYITGLDRVPGRVGVELRGGLMLCHRETTESGRLFVPWPIEGQGVPYVGTATLAENREPYNLVVELARGKLNDVRCQLADWVQMGLCAPSELTHTLKAAQHDFVRAATAPDRAEESEASARLALRWASQAGDQLMEAYTSQVLYSRLAAVSKLPTRLACALREDPRKLPAAVDWPRTFNAGHLAASWRQIAPTEGEHRFDLLDAQLAWCRRHRLPVEVGPLVEFRGGALPDWLWLWDGDFETIGGMAADYVRQVVTRYRGKVPVWHVVHRVGGGEVLGLTAEEQVRIAARLVQTARQADPSAQFTIGVDRPWAEWMGSSPFQLGPLHLCDYLLRADLGISGVALEIAPGCSAPGSHIRDLFEFSRLLDLYAMLNVPLRLWMAAPSAPDAGPGAAAEFRVETEQWPAPPTPESQAAWAARWIALAVAKPFVHTVSWMEPVDSPASAQVFPHAGLIGPDQAARPLAAWMRSFRKEALV